MKPVCSARRVNGVHTVIMHEAGKTFKFRDNSFEGAPKKASVKYPGSSFADPAYKQFVSQRKDHIKSLVQTKPLFTENDENMIDAVLCMSPDVTCIHHYKNVTHANK